MPLHFSTNGDAYQRLPNSQNTYTRLEEVFQVLPKDQVIHIEIKNQDNDQAVRAVVQLVQKYHR